MPPYKEHHPEQKRFVNDVMVELVRRYVPNSAMSGVYVLDHMGLRSTRAIREGLGSRPSVIIAESDKEIYIRMKRELRSGASLGSVNLMRCKYSELSLPVPVVLDCADMCCGLVGVGCDPPEALFRLRFSHKHYADTAIIRLTMSARGGKLTRAKFVTSTTKMMQKACKNTAYKVKALDCTDWVNGKWSTGRIVNKVAYNYGRNGPGMLTFMFLVTLNDTYVSSRGRCIVPKITMDM